ncbi:hypothetical protein C7U89_00355 [Bradyrhizobium sp. WBOS4]|nr:hypothetical protein [Bradyrhizobium sp. WBOS4]
MDKARQSRRASLGATSSPCSLDRVHADTSIAAIVDNCFAGILGSLTHLGDGGSQFGLCRDKSRLSH